LVVLAVGAVFTFLGGFFTVLFTGEYPEALRDCLVSVYRYALRSRPMSAYSPTPIHRSGWPPRNDASGRLMRVPREN
jgi:hypothetical protein